MSLHVIIAQATTAAADPNAPSVFTLPDIPTQNQLVETLLRLGEGPYGAVLAMLLFACGLVYMLQGWKIFKILIIANAAVLGAVVGARLGSMLHGENTWLYAGTAGALLFAVVAGPLMSYAISVMGGLAGSFLGYSLWHYVASTVGREDMVQYAWVGALVGLITLGLLAFIIVKAVITVVTSVQGSVMAVSGAVALLLKSESLRESLELPLRQNVHLVALLVGVPAVIGVAFQYAAVAQKAKKKKKPDGG